MPENQPIICQYCGKPTDGYCYDCEATTICGKKHGELTCCREPFHDGPCSPMHFKVFPHDEVIKHAFKDSK